MFLRIAFAFTVMALAGCNMRPDGYPRAHLQVEPGARGREQVYRIGKELSGLGPLILLDERTGVANVALTQRASAKVVTEAAKRASARVRAGLDSPGAAFLAQTRCATDRPCDVASDTACEFTAQISREDFDRYFKAYADRLSYGGYAVLAVLYKQEDPAKVVVQVPMYDDCAVGAVQLAQAWETVALEPAPAFARSDKPGTG